MRSYKEGYSIEVKPVNNGFLVEECWYDKEGEMSNYKSEKFIFSRWAEVAQFMQERFA